MARNYYSEIHLHLTWHTKESSPLLVPKIEAAAHHAIRGKCIRSDGVYVHEVGGTEDHVHMAVSILPTVVISEFIGQVKGASSHEVNQKLGDGQKVLEWQPGYGVVSFGKNNLKWVVEYIREQKRRHAERRIVERMERTEFMEDEPAQAEQRESP